MRWVFVVLLFAPPLFAASIHDNFTSEIEEYSFHREEDVHSIEKRSRRVYIVKCCGKKSCQGPPRRPNNKGNTRPNKDKGVDYYDQPALTPSPPTAEPAPVACAMQNFAALRACCQLHPTIFDYMDIDIRTCTNKTSVYTDFAYYKSVLTDYMLNQAVTMKNKLDLRRVPYAVRFMDCFFDERSWLARRDSGELFNRPMIDEFIDNIDPSWDDLLTDALTNCSKVIKTLVPWPTIVLPSNDHPMGKNVFQTYPLLVVQCMRKVMLSYCPSPNKPSLSPRCLELRTKFRTCDPFQQTSNPGSGAPTTDDYGGDYPSNPNGPEQPSEYENEPDESLYPSGPSNPLGPSEPFGPSRPLGPNESDFPGGSNDDEGEY